MDCITKYLDGFIGSGSKFTDGATQSSQFEGVVSKARDAFKEIKHDLEIGRPKSPFDPHSGSWSPPMGAMHNGINLRQMQSIKSVFCTQITTGIVCTETFDSYISVGSKLKFTRDCTIGGELISGGSVKVLNSDDVIGLKAHIDGGNSIDLGAAGIIVEINYRGMGKWEVDLRLKTLFEEMLCEEGPSVKEGDIACRIFSDIGLYKRQDVYYECFMPIERQPQIFEDWLEEQLIKSLPSIYRACEGEGHKLTAVSLMRILNTLCYLICNRAFSREGDHPDKRMEELLPLLGRLVDEYTLADYFRVGDVLHFVKEFALDGTKYSAGSSLFIDKRILGLLREMVKDGASIDLQIAGIDLTPRLPSVSGEGCIVHDTFKVGSKIEFIQSFNIRDREFHRGQKLVLKRDDVLWLRENLQGNRLEDFGLLVDKLPNDIVTEGVVTERNFLEFFKSGFVLSFLDDFSLDGITYRASDTIEITKDLERALRRKVVAEGRIDLAMAGLAVDCRIQKMCDSIMPTVAGKLFTSMTFEDMYRRHTRLTHDGQQLGVLTFTCRRYDHYEKEELEELEEVEGALVCTDEEVYKASFPLAKQVALRVGGPVKYIFGLVTPESRKSFISSRFGISSSNFPSIDMLDDATDAYDYKMEEIVSRGFDSSVLERVGCLIEQLRVMNTSLDTFFTADQSIVVSVEEEGEYNEMQRIGADFFGVYAIRTPLYGQTMSIENFLRESNESIAKAQESFRMKERAFQVWRTLIRPGKYRSSS